MDKQAHQTLRDKQRQYLLANSPRARQKAIAEFPLVVGGLASDMHSLWLRKYVDGFDSSEVDDALAFLEGKIRDTFRECFGVNIDTVIAPGAVKWVQESTPTGMEQSFYAERMNQPWRKLEDG